MTSRTRVRARTGTRLTTVAIAAIGAGLLATSCSGSSNGSTPPATTGPSAAATATGSASSPTQGSTHAGVARGSGRLDLASVCPATIVIQKDWYPEAEHGALYQLVGPDATIDADTKRVRGTLVASGKDTGVHIEIRTGGPAIGNQQVTAQLYQDPSILLGYVSSDEAVQNAGQFPTKAIVAPLEVSPQFIMWDPATYPDVKTIADLGAKNITIRYFDTAAYMRYFVQSGIVHEAQLDGSYDGSPAVFVGQKGRIAQQGFATAEPYSYEHEIKEWGKPVAYQLVHEAGWTAYPEPLAAKPDVVAKYHDCFAKLVPIVQQAQVDYAHDPTTANALIVRTVKQFKDFWIYTEGLAAWSAQQQVAIGTIGNGPNKTLGDFDQTRLQDFIAKAAPIYRAEGKDVPSTLQWSYLATNEFIDPTIGL